MPTIYYYGIDTNKGGMETYALNLINGITAKDNSIKFHLITQYENFGYKEELCSNSNFSYTIIPSRQKHPFKYMNAIYDILSKANTEDLCQINIMSYKNRLMLKAVKKSGIKTIIVGHSINNNGFLNKLLHLCGRFKYKKFGIKVANNELVVKHMFKSSKENVNLIPIGINPNKFLFNNEKRKVLRAKYNIKENDFIIGQVGRISKEKNQLFSCKVIKRANINNVHLFLIGQDYNPKVKKYVTKHNILNVHFLGEIDHIENYYNMFDLFILPSKYESAGFVFYEALANDCFSLISNNIPLNGIQTENYKVLNLKKKKWIEFIKTFKNNYKGRVFGKLKTVPTTEVQIDGYLKLYKSLSK